MGSFKCNLCNRPMPPRVYEFHLKKSHTPEEVQGQLEKNEEELAAFQQRGVEMQEEVNKALEDGSIFNKDTKIIGVVHPFDWGEVYPCNTCGEEYPAKAMPFHSWVKHRV